MGFSFSFGNHGFGESRLRKTLLKHFGVPAGEIATVGRQFPITARVDIQAAIEELLRNRSATSLLGILSPNHHEAPSLAQTLGGVRTSQSTSAQFSTTRDLELLVGKGRTYRGRVISLEGNIDPMGGGSMVKVHRLGKVARENVILPKQTLALLDRNIAGFMKAREHLKKLQFQARKGLLFYGPPGTGKTHTIHYLASEARPYNFVGNGRAGCFARRVLPAGSLSPAVHHGH